MGPGSAIPGYGWSVSGRSPVLSPCSRDTEYASVSGRYYVLGTEDYFVGCVCTEYSVQCTDYYALSSFLAAICYLITCVDIILEQPTW